MENDFRPDTIGTHMTNRSFNQDEQWHNNLVEKLKTANACLADLATRYGTLGEEFYAWPTGLVHDRHASQQAHGYSRHQFHIANTRDFPSMIWSLATVDQYLKEAAAELNTLAFRFPASAVNFQYVEYLLWTAEHGLVDTQWTVDGISKMMEGYRALINADYEGGYVRKDEDARMKTCRVKAQDHWLQVLPAAGQL